VPIETNQKTPVTNGDVTGHPDLRTRLITIPTRGKGSIMHK
jgi:hypothetical protein